MRNWVLLAAGDIVHLASLARSYGLEHTFRARLDARAEDIRLTEGQRVA